MESNKDGIKGLLVRVKTMLVTALAKIRPEKLPELGLSTGQTKKAKIEKVLRAKYCHSSSQKRSHKKYQKNTLEPAGSLSGHLRIPEFLSWCSRTVSNLKLPRISIPKPKYPQITLARLRTLKDSLPKLRLADLSANRFKLNKIKISLRLPGRYYKKFNPNTIALAAVIVILGGFLIRASSSVDAFAVEVDGSRIAVVAEKEKAEELISELKEEKALAWQRRVDVKQQVAFKATQAKRYQIDNLMSLKQKLNKNLTYVAVSTGIKVNGQIAVVVKDAQTAEDILDQLKKSYKSDGINVTAVSFHENVELVDVPVSLREVLPAEQALQRLKEGTQKKVVHVVKEGDSLWSIARANDMHVSDLLKVNPSIKGERLNIGQEINLVAHEPLINVMVTGEMTVNEPLPYKVIVKSDRSMWRGREQVKVKGENGERRVRYRLVMKNGAVVKKEVLQEQVLKPAVDKVVIKGTKYVVATRGGSGKLGWPISGKITSPYGKRWGRMHTGIDIDGVKGQPVGAAESGVVVAIGWEGAYGKMIVIRHDNGLVTRYAHLSRYEVSVGQRVQRGDLIGRIGSTGRSTGSHLHFEVLNGGSFQNPLKYLR